MMLRRVTTLIPRNATRGLKPMYAQCVRVPTGISRNLVRNFSASIPITPALSQVSPPLNIHVSKPSTPTSLDAYIIFRTRDQVKEQQWGLEQVVSQDVTFSPSALTDFQSRIDATGSSSATVSSLLYSTQGHRIVIISIGTSWSDVTIDKIRSATYTAITLLTTQRLINVGIVLNSPTFTSSTTTSTSTSITSPFSLVSTPTPSITLHHMVDAITRTAILTSYRFDKYLNKSEKPKPVANQPLKDLTLIVNPQDLSTQQVESIVQHGQTIATSTLLARTLANDRGDIVTPEYMEQQAQLIGTEYNLKCTVVHEKELRAQGLHLLASVGQAAKHGPRLVTLEYNGGKPDDAKVALVGKGICFDTGGLNLKPTGGIEGMHMDMSGSAAVLATIRAAANLRLPVNIVAVLALAENAIDAHAIKPLAIIESVKGSVEIANTDAEGRLALADAFTYVQQQYKPVQIIDMATLTGACVVALGEYAAGVFSNDDRLADSLIRAGRSTYERCWRMPILPDHAAELKGTYSDIKSTGNGRMGGACTAAAFLQKFINEGVSWAHIDIAGPAMYSSQREFMNKDGTGFGVQLLLQHIEQTLEQSSTQS